MNWINFVHHIAFGKDSGLLPADAARIRAEISRFRALTNANNRFWLRSGRLWDLSQRRPQPCMRRFRTDTDFVAAGNQSRQMRNRDTRSIGRLRCIRKISSEIRKLCRAQPLWRVLLKARLSPASLIVILWLDHFRNKRDNRRWGGADFIQSRIFKYYEVAMATTIEFTWHWNSLELFKHILTISCQSRRFFVASASEIC